MTLALIAGNHSLHIVGPWGLAWSQWFLAGINREFHIAGSIDWGSCQDSTHACVSLVADNKRHQRKSLKETDRVHQPWPKCSQPYWFLRNLAHVPFTSHCITSIHYPYFIKDHHAINICKLQSQRYYNYKVSYIYLCFFFYKMLHGLWFCLLQLLCSCVHLY